MTRNRAPQSLPPHRPAPQGAVLELQPGTEPPQHPHFPLQPRDLPELLQVMVGPTHAPSMGGWTVPPMHCSWPLPHVRGMQQGCGICIHSGDVGVPPAGDEPHCWGGEQERSPSPRRPTWLVGCKRFGFTGIGGGFICPRAKRSCCIPASRPVPALPG